MVEHGRDGELIFRETRLLFGFEPGEMTEWSGRRDFGRSIPLHYSSMVLCMHSAIRPRVSVSHSSSLTSAMGHAS